MADRFADVIIDISHKDIDRTFEYRVPEDMPLEVGDVVKIPFGNGNRTRNGYVIRIKDEPGFDVTRLKSIIGKKEGGIPIESKLICLASFMHENYGGTMINALKTVMPVRKVVTKKGNVKQVSYGLSGQKTVEELNPVQAEILDDFIQDYDFGIRNTYLLHGITGSGKTEVYIRLAEHVIQGGRQVIVLVPEIALTFQMVQRFRNVFGERISIINSKLSAGEKYRELEKARDGSTDIVIGPRSALFTPFPDTGLIIVDEEHDGAYKSENTPRYHAREIAVERARLEGASVVLGSATPSLTSYFKAKEGQYKLWEMDRRATGQELAEVKTVDLREELKAGNKSIISGILFEKMTEAFERHEKVMLFLNKRGYNSFISCRSCGEVVKCPNCSVSLSYHKGDIMMCHFCGHTEKAPKLCPKCGSPFIAGFGTGTEKVVTEVKKLFPEINVLRMDKDTTGRKGSHGEILEAFRNGSADCLVGTQMIVKGHDFPLVTVVGVLLADMGLFSDDYEAPERTFDILTQAAGRAGRSDRKGSVIIQTYNPDHYAIKAAESQDYKAFYEMEIEYRRLLRLPPVMRMMEIMISCSEPEDADEVAKGLSEELIRQVKDDETAVLGPGVARVERLNNRSRRIIYIKSIHLSKLRKAEFLVTKLIDEVYNSKDAEVQFDYE